MQIVRRNWIIEHLACHWQEEIRRLLVGLKAGLRPCNHVRLTVEVPFAFHLRLRILVLRVKLVWVDHFYSRNSDQSCNIVFFFLRLYSHIISLLQSMLTLLQSIIWNVLVGWSWERLAWPGQFMRTVLHRLEEKRLVEGASELRRRCLLALVCQLLNCSCRFLLRCLRSCCVEHARRVAERNLAWTLVARGLGEKDGGRCHRAVRHGVSGTRRSNWLIIYHHFIFLTYNLLNHDEHAWYNRAQRLTFFCLSWSLNEGPNAISDSE